MTPPTVSVFTPSHDARYLDNAWASLQAQTYGDWEWIVVLNQRARWEPPQRDERLRLHTADDLEGVGAAKQRACGLANGDVLLELDHDDELAPNALAAVMAAFEAHPDAGLVYSDFAQILANGAPDLSRFDQSYGWDYYEAEVDGRQLQVTRALDPLPHNVSLIWFAPNHVRAFRRTDYLDAGGYDATRSILDDQDLIMRLWQVSTFVCIHEPLYLQRFHEANTQRNAEVNATIQAETLALYDAGIEAATAAWAVRNDLDLVRLDSPTLPDAEESSLGLIVAIDILNRVADPIAWLNRAYWLLAHAGMLLTLTPSTDGRGAWMDPRARSYWNELTFTNLTSAPRLDGLAARFQVSRLVTYDEGGIPYVCANLAAVKDGPRLGGQLPP